MNLADICNDVLTRLRRWRWRLIVQRLILSAATVSVFVLLSLLQGTPQKIMLAQIIAIIIVMFTQLLLSQRWQQQSPVNFLLHLNRRFADFEESAQLLIEADDALTTMQTLQRSRAQSVYRQNLDQVRQWQPPLKYRGAVVILLVCVPLSFFTAELRSLAGNFLPEALQGITPGGQDTAATLIKQVSIQIQPPAYTGLESGETDQLDLEIAQGSAVEWSLSFNDGSFNSGSLSTDANSYTLEMSDGKRIALEDGNDGRWHAEATITQTDLYRVIRITGDSEEPVGDIYSLTVILDQAPQIRMIEPDVSTLEIPVNGPARFSSSALVTDDYGVDSVSILASVAKGSGEGVKFRDQKLAFERSERSGKGMLYHRDWDLQALGMEPGDEIYFTVIAIDNMQPSPNTGRSETLIVRWLEDDPPGLAAEGLAIDFIPEFFKSQRQIIIDTEQLLEDEKNLELQMFKDTSYEIGQAQADLKHKYGQYLGDEFGEGPGEQLGIMHEIAESQADNGADSDQTGDSDGHGHEEGPSINTRINTTAEILNLFGHNHGDPEIGPITKRNPVALMKRAVSEMWQAEKHLMQAEPAQALPFEYEAYKYLKLARQADRIYVKRLGFEPPPVTEDNRLSGELDEILTYATADNRGAERLTGKAADQLLLRAAYGLLSAQAPTVAFTAPQQVLLTSLSAHLMTLSQQRPALIAQAATVEKLLLSGQLQLDACPGCMDELRVSVWNLMDEGAALLHQGKAAYYNQDELIQSYQDELSKVGGNLEVAND